MIEWTITVGAIISTVLTLLGWVGGALIFVFALKSAMSVQTERLMQLGGRLINLENEIRELKNVVVSQAVQSAQISTLKAEMLAVEQRLDRIQERINGLLRGNNAMR